MQKTTDSLRDAMQSVRLREIHEDYKSANCLSRSEPINVQGKRFSQKEILSLFTQMHCRVPWVLKYRSLFEQTYPDSSAYEPSDQLSPFQSTSEAFEKWLVSAPADEIRSYENRLGPGSMILRIAHQDTLDLLRLVGLAVAEIDLASGDTELQDSALHWRRRLDEFRAILLDLEKSLRAFVDFLNVDVAVSSEGVCPKLDRHPIEYLLSNAISEIEAHKQRITQVYSSLTSKTQISDSHRSIAEAETVTRLTELAFLFIPLSFTTSIFGMQFISGSTPASTYVAVAVALTSGAYLLRFIIHRTTEQRSNLRLSIRNGVTAYAKLRVGSHISTAIFLRWLIHGIKKYTIRFWRTTFLGIVISITVVIPLPVIWTSPLKKGLQVAISCLLISIPTIFVGFYFCAKLSRRQRIRKARIRSGRNP